MKHIAKLRKCNAFWQRLDAQAVQDVIQRLDKSWARFFDYVKALKSGKKHRRIGRPRFKKSRFYTSFTLKQNGWKYEGGNRIKIGNHYFKFALSRPVTGRIKTVTIKRDRVGDLWVCFSVIENIVLPVIPDEDAVIARVGIDWGLIHTMSFSDGRAPIDAPRLLNKSLRELRRRQRRLSRRRNRNGGKRTRNTEDDRKRVARVQRRIADQRRDWQFKSAHELCDEFDGIAVEDLSGAWMQRMWGRKSSDVAWSGFLSTLGYVCSKRGVILKRVDAAYTSKTCSVCGNIVDLKLTDRDWKCQCGAYHDRDVNAAINILGRAFPNQRGDAGGLEEIPSGEAVAA